MNSGQRIFSTFLGWLPAWLGFTLIMLAGITAVVYGIAITPSAGLVAFGVAALASAVLAWVVGATSTPRVDPIGRSFGGKVDRIDGWAWLVIFGLFVVALLIRLFVS